MRPLDVDDASLRQAQEALGTTGLKATVDRALSEAVRAHRRRRLAGLMASEEAFDFDAVPIDREGQWRA